MGSHFEIVSCGHVQDKRNVEIIWKQANKQLRLKRSISAEHSESRSDALRRPAVRIPAIIFTLIASK
jgi:hypothetical protein